MRRTLFKELRRLSHLRSAMMSDIRLLAAWMLFTAAVYAFAWPTHALIADEVAYLDDALRLLGRPSACGPSGWSSYPPGVALVAAMFIGLAGRPEAAFGVGLFFWLIGFGALALLLRRWQRPVVWAFYPALFVPGLPLTRTIMSDVPSFGLAAAFLCAYAGYGDRRWGAFGAGLCAGAALLVRETNFLWAAPFLVGAAWRPAQRAGWLWTGFAIGAAVRLLWAQMHFGHWAYVRDPGIAFSLFYLPKNIAFYAFALTVLCPGGLFLMIKNKKMPFWPETAIAVAAVLLLYSAYGYDAFAKSGSLKGLVLQGRFMLPLVPFLAFAGAFSKATSLSPPLRKALLGLAASLFAAVQILGWAYNRQQQTLTHALINLPAEAHWSLSYDESRKYLNPLHTSTCLHPLLEENPPAEAFYVHLITRNDSADWRKKNAMAANALQRLARQRNLTLILDHTLSEGTRLRVWRAEAKRGR
ncbi:MAG: hypothetical protein RMJ33_10050 [Saprospiraceae bacterium]|nr:hypothetical protein [Saprospiraceae bacterium]